MRLAYVIHDFDQTNGQGRYVVELARRLRTRAEIQVFSHTADPEVLAELRDVAWTPVPAWRKRYLPFIFTFLASAERLLRDAKPDLIHAQGLSCWNADVITAHIINRARARRLPAGDWRSRCFARLLAPVEARFYRQRRARLAIVMSRRLGMELRREYGWARSIKVVPHGTDTARFHPPTDAEHLECRRRWGLPPAAWVWLFLGEAAKGLHQVIAQLAQFPRARLIVVTRSPVAAARDLAASFGVARQVSFAGFDPHPEAAYQAADVLTYPTEYESFGMVITEAMATGLAVVCGREAGAAELMTDGVDGLLINPCDPAALYGALARLELEEGLRRRLGAAARATISRYDWDACAAATWAAYTEGVQ